MRLLLLVVLGLGAGVAIGGLAAVDRGYLLVFWNGWQLTFPNLALLLILLLLGFLCLHYLLNLLRQIGYWRGGFARWNSNRRALQARKSLIDGLVALADGGWRSAEKLFLRHVADAQVPLIHYLCAARAAEEQKAEERRDRYLALAQQACPEAEVVIRLRQAEAQIRQGQAGQALVTLRMLQEQAPEQRRVLEMLAKAYQGSGDWQHLQQLLPLLKKRAVVSEAEIAVFEEHCLLEAIRRAAGQDSAAVEQIWGKAPNSLRERLGPVLGYAHKLRELGQDAKAMSLLKNRLDRVWNPALVRCFGELEAASGEQQLKDAEGWLREHPDDGELLLVLGKLCMRLSLWGKARGYFEASVSRGGGPQARQALGELLLILKEPDAALQQFRGALAEVLHEEPPSHPDRLAQPRADDRGKQLPILS